MMASTVFFLLLTFFIGVLKGTSSMTVMLNEKEILKVRTDVSFFLTSIR